MISLPRSSPIVGRSTIGGRIVPDVPISCRIIARRAALDKPGMPVGRMVGHEVEQDLKPAPMGLRKQIVEISERAEARVDAAIIGDVVAEISHR